jgi:hypothetical protein
VTGGELPEQWSWQWEPLWQPTAEEVARTQGLQIKAILDTVRIAQINKNIYADPMPIVTNEEVRQTLFGGSEFGGLNIQLMELPPVQEIAQLEAGQDDDKEGEMGVTDSIQSVLSWGNVEIGIEVMPGQKRFDKVLNGFGYGHFRKHKGEDGDALDCYLSEDFIKNPNQSDWKIFRLSQEIKGVFDEFKYFLGFDSADAVRKAYCSVMPKGFIGSIDVSSKEEILAHRVRDDFSEDSIKRTIGYIKALKMVDSEPARQLLEELKSHEG